MPKNGAGLILGIDMGGTSTKAALIDPAAITEDVDEGILGRGKADTEAREGVDEGIDAIAELIEETCDDAKVDPEQVGAIGIAVAGAVDHVEGVVLNAVNLGWSDVPLARLLHAKLGIHAVVENDVRAAVYGEQRLGAASGSRDVFGVWVGTGIGGGLILNGELFYGSFGTAGEFGRGMVLPWTPPGEGSLEQVCSRTGVAETLVRLLRSNRTSSLQMPEDNDPRRIRSKDIARALDAGDELVAEVVDHSAHVLGVAIGGIVTLLSLECVVLGGGLVQALGSAYSKRVQEGVQKAVFPDVLRSVKVLRSKLGDDAGPIGAAMLASRRLGVRVRAPSSPSSTPPAAAG